METIRTKTKSEKEALIHEFLASQKSKTTWCKENKISSSTFYKWLKIYEQEHKTVKFISLKDNSNAYNKENKNQNPVNVESVDILLEIGACKIHISNTTSITLLTEVIKAVNSINV